MFDRFRFFLLVAVCGLSTIVLTYIHQNILTIENSNLDLIRQKLDVRGDLLINTSECQVEYFPPWSKTSKKLFKNRAKLNCSRKQEIMNLTWVDNGYLTISRTKIKYLTNNSVKCSYRQISRKSDTDFGINLGKLIDMNFEKNTSFYLGKMEFIAVNCTRKNKLIYENFHTNIYKKDGKNVNEKIDNPFNLLFIGIDSTSRNNLIRNMPEVYDYLLNKMNAIDLKSFIKIAGYTLGNIGVMLTGKWVQEWDGFKSKPFLDKYHYAFQDFADRGYMTLMGEDDSPLSMFKSAVKGFKHQPTDYWSLPFASAALSGKLSPDSLCFGQKSTFHSISDWFLDFERLYKDRPWWAHLHFSLSVHNSLNALSAVKDDYLSFFRTAHEKDIFKNSFLFFYADHGLRYGEFRQSYVGRYEEHLPFMIIIPPKDFTKRYPVYHENLISNIDKISTYFDVHKTLYHILNLNNETNFYNKYNSKRGISLFHQIPDNRTCKTAPIRDADCLCKRQLELSTKNSLVKSITSFAFSEMEKLLKKYDTKNLCKKISLYKATSASVLIKSMGKDIPKTLESFKKKTENAYAKFFINFFIKPSFGLFEALIGYSFDSKKMTLLSNFERLNSYQNESNCIDSRQIKGICFCSEK